MIDCIEKVLLSIENRLFAFKKFVKLMLFNSVFILIAELIKTKSMLSLN